MVETETVKEAFLIRQKYRDYRQSKETIKKDHSKFAEDKPQLFDMITSDHCDDTILNQMMGAYKAVNAGSISQHDASVFVGEKLVDTFVKPNLPPKDKED